MTQQDFNISLRQRLRDRLPPSARDRLSLATYDQAIRFNIIIVAALPRTPWPWSSRTIPTLKKVLDDLTVAAVPC